MPDPQASPNSSPEPKLDNEVGSFLTLLLVLVAAAALGYSGLKFFDFIQLPVTTPPPGLIS